MHRLAGVTAHVVLRARRALAVEVDEQQARYFLYARGEKYVLELVAAARRVRS